MNELEQLKQWIHAAETGVGVALAEGRGTDALAMLEALNKLGTRYMDIRIHQRQMEQDASMRAALGPVE